VSIAWAVSEHLLNVVCCRTLFATHYHELTSMEHPHMKNLSLAVLENEGEIVFLKRLKEGPAAGSYGLHVAKLAGIPGAVLARAKELQGRFVSFEHSLSPSGAAPEFATDAEASLAQGHPLPQAVSLTQGSTKQSAELFSPDDIAVAKLKSVDPDRMTPLEALQLIAELSAMLH
jgi:DNA mismatch repair protein MutS